MVTLDERFQYIPKVSDRAAESLWYIPKVFEKECRNFLDLLNVY